jgi:glutamyl-tRNA synthetase
VSVRVRMAPSPTGFLHIGGVRTFLFNWLFARGRGGECLLRIENTDTSREVAEATEQIQRSLRWLGIDWDGPVTFQLDAMDRCRELARRLLEEGKAYEDEGAIRFRMPDEGITAWDDAVRGRIEFPNDQLEDLVLVRSDGRPTYNFANPVEDMDDAITHVIRGNDHVSNTPKQLQILAALGHEPPVYAHVPDVLGDDGKKLSKRHGATSVDEFRAAGYIPPALMNFLALLGWAPDGETTIMPPAELIERFSLDRVGSSPATLDYQKLDWMNGVYLRAMAPDEYADALVAHLRGQGNEWPEERIRQAAPLVQEKIERLGQFREFAGFFFERRDGYDRSELDPRILAEAEEVLRTLEPFTAESIEQALRGLAERLGQKPRQAFQPIRIAVTGSKVSPGLFESIELLGREETLARIRAARGEEA